MVIVAIPGLRINHYQVQIAREHGFLTFPGFLDNHFIEEKGKADLTYLKRMLKRYAVGAIVFAVAPDYDHEEMHKLKAQYPDINWIFPLHSRDEDFSDFEWVGYPHREKLRDYSIGWFMKATEGKKRWYLGFWDESNPYVVKKFDGLDTTLPSYYADRLGKIWYTWRKHESVNKYLERRELFVHNIIIFKLQILRVFDSTLGAQELHDFVEDRGELFG